MNVSEEQLEDPTLQAEGQERSYKKAFENFVAELEGLSDPEAKLNKAIAFMESALSQGGAPHFKSFWEVRTLCIDLFKKSINPISRTLLWTKYSDLSKEARRLKEILEEQSAFASEQIEIAITALEKEIEGQVQNSLIQFPVTCQLLDRKAKLYSDIQQELQWLNAQATRINALRKELIKTEMRIKQKNKFFQRLSAAGDKIFPKRKELIKEISQYFVEDVDDFIASHFKGKEIQDSLFFLREEIKALQGLAKLFTLNTHAFTHTRMALSKCWDQVKEADKERKKILSDKKEIFKENYDKLHAEIEAFRESNLSLADAEKGLDEIVALMRQMELGRDELKQLRMELASARQPFQERQRALESEKKQQILDREMLRKKGAQELLEKCEELIANAPHMDVDQLSNQRDELLSKIASTSLSKGERQDFERRLKPLRDLIAEKKEQALLTLSDDDRQVLQKLKELLKEKRELRQEIKSQIEHYRKAVHGSGLDFELSMNYNAQLTAEKERLDKINEGIREIENKIDEIESNTRF